MKSRGVIPHLLVCRIDFFYPFYTQVNVFCLANPNKIVNYVLIVRCSVHVIRYQYNINRFYYHYNNNNTLRVVVNALRITIILIDIIYYTFDF